MSKKMEVRAKRMTEPDFSTDPYTKNESDKPKYSIRNICNGPDNGGSADDFTVVFHSTAKCRRRDQLFE
jgi:hypothetical protein